MQDDFFSLHRNEHFETKKKSAYEKESIEDLTLD